MTKNEFLQQASMRCCAGLLARGDNSMATALAGAVDLADKLGSALERQGVVFDTAEQLAAPQKLWVGYTTRGDIYYIKVNDTVILGTASERIARDVVTKLRMGLCLALTQPYDSDVPAPFVLTESGRDE